MDYHSKLFRVFVLALSFFLPVAVFAATSPSLGSSSTYAITSSTYTNSLNAALETAITGDLCYTTGPGTTPVSISGATVVPCADARGTDQSSALADVNGQACTSLGTNVVLSGTFTPGCYSSSGTMDIALSTTITLNGAGTYIFRSGGALTTGANSVVALSGGASACDIFWAPGGATHIGANSSTSVTPTFVGNILQNSLAAFDVTVGHFVNLSGRILAFGRTVTTDSNTIAIPTGCTVSPATLHVVKHVINDNGGTASAANWNLAVTSSNSGTGVGNASGTESGTTYTLQTGKQYSVAESGGPSGYTGSLSSDCNIASAVAGTIYNCTITNDDIAPILHLRKVIDNTGGGAALNTAWTITATGALGSPTNLTGTTPVDSSGTFKADTYTLAESGGPTGYTASVFSCVKNGGGAVVSNTITLANNDVATCTITNTFIPATTETITVIKLVVGGTKGVSDFPLFVNGSPVTSGVTNSFAAPATYTVTETNNNSNYTASFSGLCPGGVITLAVGTPKVCTITNTYASTGSAGLNVVPVPPLIDVVKVPSPLALPNGPGLVTYTYTLHNIGTVPVSNITLVGDTCSPINLISGDKNNNNILEVNEVWTYNCFTTLTKTHTNTVVATGWANGISATDVASATVVVGASIVPPLIHVTKIPSPLLLSTEGGMITYTNKVSNPGTVALSNVKLIDDKCGPVKYISGDTNGDSKLDVTETWTYTCNANLNKTTTNTVTATGDANGLNATDFAIATVVVAPTVPSLPKTGYAPLPIYAFIKNILKIISDHY